MNSYSLDVEMFISEVKKYPELWDLQSEDYRLKSKKQNAWTEIARLFITDFDDMSTLEKIEVHRKLHGKWRNIRDSFVRHQKRKYSKRGYLYAKHLTFLNNLYKQNSQSGSEADSDNYERSDEEDDAKIKSLDLKNKTFELVNDSVWGSDVEDSTSTIENLKRRRRDKQDLNLEFVEAASQDATSTYTSPVDEDKSFFESLLPAVRIFNMDQKLEFRWEVLRLIKNIRSAGEKRNFIKLDPETRSN